MKQRRRRTRITMRKQEVLIVRGRAQIAELKCLVCGTPFPIDTMAAAHAQEAAAQAELKDNGEGKLLPTTCPHNHDD